MNKFGKSSLEKLGTCHPDLQKIMKLAISRSNVDFGISEGYRDVGRQNKLFKEGKSKIDGLTKLGKHNISPSEAVDIYIYNPDPVMQKKVMYDIAHLAYVAGVIQSCAKELYNKGEITHKVRSGLDWNSNGVISFDQTFDDYPHHEIIE